MKVYLVMQPDEEFGVDEFTGYAYLDNSLASRHAKAIWAGSVTEAEVLTELPGWVKG